MTTTEQAARIASIAREITAAMEAFPRLNRKQQTNLAIGGDLLVERLHVAWAQFVGDQWKERDPADHQLANQVASPLRKALNP